MVNAMQAALVSLYFKYRDEEEIVEMIEDLGLNIWALNLEYLMEVGHLVPYTKKTGEEGLMAVSQLACELEAKLEEKVWSDYWGRH